MKKLISALILLSLTGMSYADIANQNIRLTNQQQTVDINLPANSTTGYQWFVQNYDHDLLSLEDYRYAAGNTNAVGKGGTATFSFSVDPRFYDAPQATTVTLVYQQPWNPGQNSSTVTVTLSSTSSSNDQLSWQKYPDVPAAPMPTSAPQQSGNTADSTTTTDASANWISLPTTATTNS